MKKDLVSVIIPNWNGVDLLKICLNSVKKQTYRNLEIIVVDNNSTDESVLFIKKNYSDIKILELGSNFGFSKAVNKAIKVALGEYIFLLNNDTEVDRECVELLLRNFSKREVGFVVPKVLNFYKRNILELAGKSFVIDVVGHLFSLCAGKKDTKEYNIPDYTFLAPGGASIFKKNVFKKIGLFDEEYFMYLEDADLSLRAQISGIKGWYEPKAVVYHMGGASSKKNFQMVEMQNFRNMTMTIIKNYPLSIFWENFNFIKIIFVHLNTLRYLFLKGYGLSVLFTELEIITKIPGLLGKRKNIMILKKVSDDYIKQNIFKKSFF